MISCFQLEYWRHSIPNEWICAPSDRSVWRVVPRKNWKKSWISLIISNDLYFIEIDNRRGGKQDIIWFWIRNGLGGPSGGPVSLSPVPIETDSFRSSKIGFLIFHLLLFSFFTRRTIRRNFFIMIQFSFVVIRGDNKNSMPFRYAYKSSPTSFLKIPS